VIKVSVLYPYQANARFDFDYYLNSHIPLVSRLLGSACKAVAVDQGLAGGTPDAPPSYIAMAHLYFDSVAVFQASFGPHASALMDDIPTFTDCNPVVQVSAVLLAP
jgi:uncharacterized protein (TIGR02118 family)